MKQGIGQKWETEKAIKKISQMKGRKMGKKLVGIGRSVSRKHGQKNK